MRYPGILVGILLLVSGHVFASSITYSGDTTGGPTFNRIFGGSPPFVLSGTGTAVPYDAFTFHVDLTGTYSMEQTAESFDGYFNFYQGSFNPLDPLTNAVATNDDDGPACQYCPMIADITLTSGVTYILVSTGFGNSDYGSFTNVISGVGNPIEGAVPEPATFALVGLGFVGLGFWRRRKHNIGSR